MAIYRVERTRDYTVMSNCHLKDTALSLKAKGLLSLILSLPDDWNYSTRGLASICKEGVELVGSTIKELEKAGYIVRRQLRGEDGKLGAVEYIIYEKPQLPASPAQDTDPAEGGCPPRPDLPCTDSPCTGFPDTVSPDTGVPGTGTHGPRCWQYTQ